MSSFTWRAHGAACSNWRKRERAKQESFAGRGVRSRETSWKPSETREGGSSEDWREGIEKRNLKGFNTVARILPMP